MRSYVHESKRRNRGALALISRPKAVDCTPVARGAASSFRLHFDFMPLHFDFMPPLTKTFSPSCKLFSQCIMNSSRFMWCFLSTLAPHPWSW